MMNRRTLKHLAYATFLIVAAWMALSFTGVVVKADSTFSWAASLFGSLATSVLICPTPLIFDDPAPADPFRSDPLPTTDGRLRASPHPRSSSPPSIPRDHSQAS